MVSLYSRVRHVAVAVPEGRESGEEIEERLRARNPGLQVRSGLLRQMYGFEQRPVAPADVLPSDLAAEAGRRALDQAGLSASDVDLLIYAGIAEDMVEPAMSHIVAHKLGATAAVFDVQNACNGVLNAIQVADSLIRTGQYGRALVVAGDLGSRTSRWDVPSRRELALSLAGYTTGDMGAGVLMEADATPGVVGTYFTANSAGWSAATLVNPYWANGRDTVLRVDSDALFRSFAGMDTAAREALHSMGCKVDDLAVVCVHQASVPFTRAFCDTLGIPDDKLTLTFPRYGNVTTASLPLQLAEAVGKGRLRKNDLVALFGLASGASGGLVLIQW